MEDVLFLPVSSRFVLFLCVFTIDLFVGKGVLEMLTISSDSEISGFLTPVQSFVWCQPSRVVVSETDSVCPNFFLAL